MSVAPVFSALGDPARLAIVDRLCREGPLPTARLRPAGVSRQGVTKHLRVLQEAGLLDSRRVGRDRQWAMRVDSVVALRDRLDAMAARWDVRLARLRALVEDDAG